MFGIALAIALYGAAIAAGATFGVKAAAK